VTEAVSPKSVGRLALIGVEASEYQNFIHGHYGAMLANAFLEQSDLFFLPLSVLDVEFVPIVEVAGSVPSSEDGHLILPLHTPSAGSSARGDSLELLNIPSFRNEIELVKIRRTIV